MLNRNRGGLDRHSDNGWVESVYGDNLAISGPIGSSPNILAIVETTGERGVRGLCHPQPARDVLSNVMETACPQHTRRALR
jgi:hypothetical protein